MSTSGSGRPTLGRRPYPPLPSSEEVALSGSLTALLGRDSLGGLTLVAKTSIICHVTPKFGPLAAIPPAPSILSYL